MIIEQARSSLMQHPQTNLLLLDGDSVFAHNVATCLAEQSHLRLHVLSRTPRTPLRFSRHCSSYHIYAPTDDAQRVRAIRENIRRTEAEILLPVGQDAIRWVIKHQKEFTDILALPLMPDLTIFDTVADKWRLVCFLEQHNLPHPPTLLAADAHGAPACTDLLHFPILLKPRDGVNGSDIMRFETADALTAHLTELGWETSRYLIQRFLPGEDIGCNVLCEQGRILAYTIQHPFLPLPHLFGPGTGVQFLKHSKTLEVIRNLMAALNWSGIANIDLRLAPDGTISILEINPRYWGSLLASLAAGVNFPWLSCQASLGLSFPEPDYAPIRFVGKHRHWSPFPSLGHTKHSHPALADITLQESVWRYSLRDPLPDIYYLLHRTGAI
jgi:D-aspartate ligase